MAMGGSERPAWPAMAEPEGGRPAGRGRLLDRWLSYAVSCVVHTAFALLLALFTLMPMDDETMVVTMTEHEAAVELLETPDLKLDATLLPKVKPQNLIAAPPLPNRPQASGPVGLDLSPDIGPPEELFPGFGGEGSDGMFVGGAGGLGGEFNKRLKIARAKSGDVQISLLWHNYNDLDLHVRCPSGEVISYQDKNSRCGGELDVDMNVRSRHSREPVENIYWRKGRAPKGKFEVAVNLFRNHRDGDPSKFVVRVVRDGKEAFFYGTVSKRVPWQTVCAFRRL